MAAAKLSDRIIAGPVLRTQPDRRLVALTREGSRPASEEIVRRYRPALIRYAASIVPADRADDVVQDSLARALPALAAGVEELRLRPWLYTVVRNTALNDLRDAGPACEQLDESYDGVEQPPQALERRERMRSLLAGIQGLPGAQRQALLKRELEGRSHAEIGAELGVSAGAARQLIFRARQALRDGIGALVPMPLLRQLVEGEAGAAAAATGGGAFAAKAAIAALATGAVLTAGVSLHRAGDGPAPSAATPTSPAASPGPTRTPTPASPSSPSEAKRTRARAAPATEATGTATERRGSGNGVAVDVVRRHESSPPSSAPSPGRHGGGGNETRGSDGGSGGLLEATPTQTEELSGDGSGGEGSVDGSSEDGPSGDSVSSGDASEPISVESRDSGEDDVSSSSTEPQPKEEG